jgi:Ca2+-binding RTX toxin-like protein
MTDRFLARAVLLGTLTAALAAGAQAPALAARAEVSAGNVVYNAGPGEVNNLRLINSSGFGEDGVLIVFDDHPIAHGPGCTTPDGSVRDFVHCRTKVPAPGAVIDLGDGDDGFLAQGNSGRTYSSFSVQLGPGNDKVPEFLAPAQVDGGPGNDRVTGSRGADRLKGGDGNDYVLGRGNLDFLDGGPGADRVTAAFTGGASLFGGSGPDIITTGPGVAALVNAGSGNDRVLGESRWAGGSRYINLPARSTRPINCGSGTDRVRVTRRQAVRSCEGRLR